MVRFDGDVMGEFDVINVLEDREPLADGRDTNLFK